VKVADLKRFARGWLAGAKRQRLVVRPK
jgi:hypothetical protein